jgi:non-heme chloroperoxidase
MEQLAKFGEVNRVIAIDLRSQGVSTKREAGNAPESRARDLHDVLARRKISKSALVAWSQGAQDVTRIQQSDPLERFDLRKSSPGIFRRNGPIAVQETSPGSRLPSTVKSTLQTPSNTGIAMLISDIFGADRRPALAKLDKPALVIASGNSPPLDVQKEMAASIPGGKLVVIGGTAHALFVDDPTACDAALQSFLEFLPGWSAALQSK